MATSVRRFRKSDAEETSKMLRAAFEWFHKGDENSWLWKSFEPFELISKSKELDILVATDNDGVVIGYISSSSTPYGVAYIQAVAVHPRLKRRGIGGRLLSEKLRFLHERSIRKVWLLVTSSNVEAISFYLKNKFVIEGYLRAHTGPQSDEVLLSRFLDSNPP